MQHFEVLSAGVKSSILLDALKDLTGVLSSIGPPVVDGPIRSRLVENGSLGQLEHVKAGSQTHGLGPGTCNHQQEDAEQSTLTGVPANFSRPARPMVFSSKSGVCGGSNIA